MEKILLPKKLTAENGAKSLLIGEFKETIKIPNPSFCGCGKCDFCEDFPDEPEFIDEDVFISWDTIKLIYDKIVKHFDNECI